MIPPRVGRDYLLSDAWRRRLPLLPALLFLILLTQVPFGLSIYYSLTDWTVVPPGPREFVGLENYRELFRDDFFGDAIAAAPIDNPGTTPRPGVPGVQYVGIPEFQDVGNQCTEQFSAVIAGRSSVDSALENCQSIASQVGG